MADEPDMDNRDPNELNSHVRNDFEDVFGEPGGVRSFDRLWRNSYKCFDCGKNCCYKFLTTLCGLCIAVFWGCDFAITAFGHIWCHTPCLRDFSIIVGCWQRAFGTVVNCFVATFCEACSMCFSQIHVKFEDVFGEPEGAHSIDCLWRNSYKCFECGKELCYKILTTLCGLCIALWWGCDFAMTAFHHIWCYTPCMRDFSIGIGCWQRAFATIVNCCVVPCCSACGHFFSQIHVHNK